jgi:hypothetical protein
VTHPEHTSRTPSYSPARVAALLVVVVFAIALSAGSAPARAASCSKTEGIFLGGGGAAIAKSTHTSLSFQANYYPFGCETQWRFQYATSKNGPWEPVPGGSGSDAGNQDSVKAESGEVTGLSVETPYYVRFTVTDLVESPSEISGPFETIPLRPEVEQERPAITAVSETSARAETSVLADGSETQWSYEFATSESGPWTAVPGASGTISTVEAEKAEKEEGGSQRYLKASAELSGLQAGIFYFVRLSAKNKFGQSTSSVAGFQTAGPPVAATFAVHAIHGEGMRVLGSVRPDGYDTHYHFEYVTQGEWEKSGFAGAASTAEVDAGSGGLTGNGFPTVLVWQDLAGLQAGESYRFRLVARSTASGNPVRMGAEQTLTVPTPAKPGPQESCPNEALRSGPSAHLPDCRAYEQVTPANKEGALDSFNYSISLPHTQVGEDGEHFLVQSAGTQWGASPDPLVSGYFFTRTPTGWQMTSARPAGEASPSFYKPLLLSADLTEIGLEAGWTTGGVNKSEDLEFKAGPVGGPYTAVAPLVPREDVEYEKAWVAASAGGGKLILQTRDYQLLGRPTGTLSGNDLYEFAGGQLRQVNVTSSGSPISTCGARMVMGAEGYQEQAIGGASGKSSSSHAVSGDGSRVFFEDNCTHRLYMRVAGVETRDIGEYHFLGANPEGTKLLLEKLSGETYEIFSYDTAAALAKHLLSTREQVGDPIVSEELTAFYFRSEESLTPDAPPVASTSGSEAAGGDLYRYDIASEKLGFVVQKQQDGGGAGGFSVSPDGRYFYFGSRGIAGVPGGGDLPGETKPAAQAYRYDSVEGVVQCMSCASPFDPEPKLDASFFPPESVVASIDGLPNPTVSSANGDYVFFNTAAALVPQDVDGEVPPTSQLSPNADLYVSVSTDVYEWRKDGVDGCVRVQGCLALISTGRGGLKVELLGTTASGRDVFFTTHESLVPQDADKAGDVYDARIGGGVSPPAPGPVECEGDACSTPASPPNDSTPSSFTFSGVGNLGVTLPVVKPKPKTKAGKKCKANAKKKCKAKHKKRTGKKTKKSNHRRGK